MYGIGQALKNYTHTNRRGEKMPSCPDCHIFKGLWSELKAKDNGEFICGVNPAHTYLKDERGYFHKKKNH